jgi:hypothetical protein
MNQLQKKQNLNLTLKCLKRYQKLKFKQQPILNEPFSTQRQVCLYNMGNLLQFRLEIGLLSYMMSQLKLQGPSHILIFYSIVALTFLKFI